MVTPKKLLVKRTQSISVQNPSSFPTSLATPTVQRVVVQSPIAKAPTPPPSQPIQFQFMKASKKKLATGAREDCAGRKFHEECYYNFKALVASPLTKFSTKLCRRYFLEPFMVPRPFFYPHIIQEFY
ncbi:hypothetical protein PVL29_004626 [Vitis rotundifolia]|uniref:Uncharacterized protein n=1 Tax=Vitis rotundifolia TaxID=103349 RepID=A0AA39E0N8_VITRO|nr:hypothetical protein PVL29_004626 [Vitis rotundifolia]